jgi:biopolymer transport protein ExbB
MHGGEDRQRQRENVEDTGRPLALELERYLNMLGTLATVSPLIGLFVAIPSYIFHRYYRGRVDELVADLERQAAELAESLAQLAARLHRDRAALRA